MKRITILLILLATPLLLLTPPLAHATTCTGTDSNAFVPTGPPTVISSSVVNGFSITKESFGLCFTGVFNGTTQGTVTIIVNLSTGNGIFYGQNAFTGTVTTGSGTLAGTVLSPFSATFSGGNFHGGFTLYGGTGALQGLTGFGTIQGSLLTFVGTYTANLF